MAKQPPLTLVFDFDGTLADTLAQVVDITNSLADEHGFKKIDEDTLAELRHKTSQEMIRYLGIPLMKIPLLMRKAKETLHESIDQIALFDGLKETLDTLQKNNCQLGILSSNSQNNIERFLEKHELTCFDFVQSTSKIWGKNKALRNLIKSQGLDKDKLIYIGDESRDIDAAKKVGLKVAAVSWGYNSRQMLQDHNPTYLIDSPQDLCELLK